jgi:hypothetical protein
MHKSLPKIYMTVLEAECGDGAIAIEMNVFLKRGWEAMIWLYTVECPVDVFGDLIMINLRP